jgi:stage II sporulation protein AA (anti-sigma F factor antagonist)
MGDSPHLDIATSQEGPVARVRLAGELDLDGVGVVTGALTELAGNGATSVLVDASGLTFLDSSGLRALLSGRKALGDVNVSLVIEQASPAVERVLEITGTRELLLPS